MSDDKIIRIPDEAFEPDAAYQPWQEDVIQTDDSQFLFSTPAEAERPPVKKSGWLKQLLITFGAIWLGLLLAGPAIDAACVKGRISGLQALAINNHDWNKCPRYMNGVCEAERMDRVLRHECSDLSRKILFRDQVNDVRKWWRKL